MRKWKRSLWISVTTWLHPHQYDTMEHVTAALTHSNEQINILHNPVFKKLGYCPQSNEKQNEMICTASKIQFHAKQQQERVNYLNW